ncbi:amino acid carrier protein [Halobacteriovorax sp. BALOs_7]|uniref:alanine/glycine:cation symporter family protein n=1 Tax=Halobacteriovorax sp. BALOs_7 TaxID=2109558 RepID=UPI000EA18DD7|nr:alanine/glycine:cation symporter family protein [Halobacteriovorax sp. BALOs_7]AYF44573.1 amino acid carrier protein [Halobacteriovorax sp. BALOs_7]
MNFSAFLAEAVEIVWGLPLIILLLGGGIYLVAISRLKTLAGFFHAFRLISGKFHHKNDNESKGQISHFKALTNALSSTVGMGNVAGVAVAISQGGPGAIFWMWVGALIGMNTKFFECTLAVMYRRNDHHGEIQGGPMYTIIEALPKYLHFLAYFFAGAGLIGSLGVFNTNQMATFMASNYSIPTHITGILAAVLLVYILMGGVKRIGEATSKLVPAMCTLYIGCALVIIIMNFGNVADVFALIFKEAFAGRAAVGGVSGLAVIHIFKTGIKRATYSNEAGVGSAPMAHGNAKTSEPVAEGLVAMVGPFIDTIIVCTMTSIVILSSLSPAELQESNGVLITQIAFMKNFGMAGSHLLGISIILFALSTVIGSANYCEKCWDFLFGGVPIMGARLTFALFYASTVLLGAVSAPTDMVNAMDIGFALMAIPNMIATIALAPKVKHKFDEYYEKYIRKSAA